MFKSEQFWLKVRFYSTAFVLLFGSWGMGYMVSWFFMPLPFGIFVLSAFPANKSQRLWLQCLVLLIAAMVALCISVLIMFLLIPFTFLYAPLGIFMGVLAFLASFPAAYFGAKLLLQEIDARFLRTEN
jgi:hypothetical protein